MNPTLPRLSTTAALLWLASLTPIHAQHPRIEVGQTVSGSLDGSDPLPSERGRFEVFQFEGSAGERLTATMRSDAFDAFLRLGRTLGGVTDELDRDDDGGGGTDARLRVILPTDGTYLLIAQALDPSGAGPFTLALEGTPEPTTAVPVPVEIGAEVFGELAETDAFDDDQDTFYDVWTSEAPAGTRLVASMESDAFDAFLIFGRLDADGRFEEIEYDDDGGQGTNSRLHVRVPNTGAYELRAASIGPETGPYMLSLFEGPEPAATASRQPIRANAPESGALEETDALLDDGRFHDYWLYEGRAGERVAIRLGSEDFDAFLAFGRLTGEVFDLSVDNDDGPYGTDSEIDVTLPADGTWAIRATSLSPGEIGRYELEVTSP
jgi:hypothetical protein